MNPTSATNIATMSGGRLTSGTGLEEISRVTTDSRSSRPGDLFVALVGDNFDGHDFAGQAATAGAAAILVSQPIQANCAVIQVSDTLNGLQALAKNYRSQLSCRVIGITGSNGKTSTKDFCAAVLGDAYSVSKTLGNLNNHIGLPLSVLALDDSHGMAILEMGMNHAGEIAPLAAIASPDVAIITNIGVAHIEFLKTQEAIAEEKGALVDAIHPDGLVILNANDPFTPALARCSKARVVTAGLKKGDLFAHDIHPESSGTRFSISWKKETVSAFLPVPGLHMVGNAMLAVAVGVMHDIALKNCANALEKTLLTPGRLELKTIGGIHFLDDTYNANPDSMIAALNTLNDLPGAGKRVAVLGAMGELGAFSEEGHRSVGRAAQSVDVLVTVGETASWIADEAEKNRSTRIIRAADSGQAAAALLTLLHPDDCVLVKGSRSARMEQVIHDLTASLQPVPASA